MQPLIFSGVLFNQGYSNRPFTKASTDITLNKKPRVVPEALLIYR